MARKLVIINPIRRRSLFPLNTVTEFVREQLTIT